MKRSFIILLSFSLSLFFTEAKDTIPKVHFQKDTINSDQLNTSDMGVRLQLRTKYKYVKNARKGIFSSLSKFFISFVDGSFEEKDDEFSQVEKLLGIDLGLFLERAEVMPNNQDLQYQLILAEDEKDDEKIDQLKKEIREVDRQWKREYDNNTKGWIAISDLQSTVQSLIDKIQSNPYYELTPIHRTV